MLRTIVLWLRQSTLTRVRARETFSGLRRPDQMALFLMLMDDVS
jgi:hypothetical protein